MKSGKILVSFKDSANSIYKLNNDSIIFSVTDFDKTEPQVLDFRILDLQQNQVEFYVLCNEIVTLYYYVGNEIGKIKLRSLGNKSSRLQNLFLRKI